MGRKLIICCDGTWSSERGRTSQKKHKEDSHSHTSYDSNVIQFTRALAPVHLGNNSDQIVYFDAGDDIGNTVTNYLSQIFGGTGIDQKIQQAYRFLANNYQPGDQIFCLGFSKGAYVVRSLCALLSSCGLLSRANIDEFPTIYHYFKTPPALRTESHFYKALSLIEETKAHQLSPAIHFLGVWDCLGGQGIPHPLFRALSPMMQIGFHDTALPNNVVHAYQALAIDEKRPCFQADLWTDADTSSFVKQVWFAGTHDDMGGRQSETTLSAQPLLWMIHHAERQGLAFDQGYIDEHILAPLWSDMRKIKTDTSDSDKTRLFHLVWPKPSIRLPNQSCFGLHNNQHAIKEFIHPSVVERWNNNSLHYKPDNISASLFKELPLSDSKRIKQAELINLERRRNERKSLNNEEALLHIDGEQQACCVIDFSKGKGLRIKSALPLNTGSHISIESASTGHLKGTVVWNTQDEAGVELQA
jgi:hypothetical protein